MGKKKTAPPGTPRFRRPVPDSVRLFRVRIGRRLAELRAVRGLSQADLARLSGIPKRSISNWEQGGAAMPLEKAVEICEALTVGLLDVLEPPEDASPSRPGRPARTA